MLTVDALSGLTKDTQHLPDSSFYLGCADILAKEASEVFPKTQRRNRRYSLLQEIEGHLKYALSLFANDKESYQEDQKNGFLERKYYVDQELKKLQVQHIKMLIKELVVV